LRFQLKLDILFFLLNSASLASFYGNFFPFFKESISDAHKDIRIGTLKCLVNLFDNIDDMKNEEVNLYKELVAPILNILDSLID